jgi:hypothetical protein
MTRRTADLVDRLLTEIAEARAEHAQERREWAQERTVLLNRIQDPPAAVAMTMATLPPPGELDMDIR